MKRLLIGLMAAMMVACATHTVKPVVAVTPPDTKVIVAEHWTLEVPLHMDVVQENHSTKALYKDSTTGLIVVVRVDKFDKPLDSMVLNLLDYLRSEGSHILLATPVTWLNNDAALIRLVSPDGVAMANMWVTVWNHQATSLVCGSGSLPAIESQKVCDNIAKHFTLK